MITRISDRDKKRAVEMYTKGMTVNEIRFNLLSGKEVAQKTVRNAVLEGGYGLVCYCDYCKSQKPFVAAVRGGREFCNDCGRYV